MKKFNLTLLIYLLVTSADVCTAQLSNYFYTVAYSVGALKFARVDKATGVLTNFTTIPVTTSSQAGSSCIDNQAKTFYFCNDGRQLFSFNAFNGSIISNINLPLSTNQRFTYMQFSPCDSNLYGMLFDPFATQVMKFARFNLATNTFTVIANMPAGTSSCGGCMSFIDPVANLYVLDNGNVLGLNMTNGQIVYNSPIVNQQGSSFHHIDQYCPNGLIYGTSGGSVKRLSTINPLTGVVSYVSSATWNVGINKPANGGNCIDQTAGIYYYSGDPTGIYGAQLSTGALVYNMPVTGANALLHLEHFSECACTSTGLTDGLMTERIISFFPSPFKDIITVESNFTGDAELILYDASLQKLITMHFKERIAFETNKLAKGIYFFEVRYKDGIVKKGKVMKL